MKHLKLFIIAINLVAIISQYGLSLYRSDAGVKLSQLSVETSNLQTENTQLSKLYYQLASLGYIETRASELNLITVPITTLSPITVADALSHPSN